MAAFMLAQAENWYYFGSTGWWDDDFIWNDLYDKGATLSCLLMVPQHCNYSNSSCHCTATGCGKPTEPAPLPGTGPVYKRTFEKCKVSLDCTNSSFCVGDIDFGTI